MSNFSQHIASSAFWICLFRTAKKEEHAPRSTRKKHNLLLKHVKTSFLGSPQDSYSLSELLGPLSRRRGKVGPSETESLVLTLAKPLSPSKEKHKSTTSLHPGINGRSTTTTASIKCKQPLRSMNFLSHRAIQSSHPPRRKTPRSIYRILSIYAVIDFGLF